MFERGAWGVIRLNDTGEMLLNQETKDFEVTRVGMTPKYGTGG